MSEESLSEMRRKNTEEKQAEMPSLINIITALAQRDCFPSDKLVRVLDGHDNLLSYQFEFANPWYVAQPVSTIESLRIEIDDQPVGTCDLALVIRDQIVPIDVARTFHELWWGFAEIARVEIKAGVVRELAPGSCVDLKLVLDMRTTINYGLKDNLAQYVLNHRLEVE